MMMDLIAWFLDLVPIMIVLATKPFSLVLLSCIFGVRSFCIVIDTWVELLIAAVSIHVNIFCRLMTWTFAFISLPVRVLTAMQRERLLQMHLREQQIELENLVWNRKELEEHLQMAIRECRMMEAMLAELEDEQDEAISKLELLENELQVMKKENLRLKEIQAKGFWGLQSQDDTGRAGDRDNDVADMYGISHGIQSWKSSSNGSNIILQDLLMHKDAWGDESKSKIESLDFMKTVLKAGGPSHTITPGIISKNLEVDAVLGQRRDVALLQSMFSAVLSLLVGIIIWEAEDPCMPLVVALFTVVGISLKSVVQFFITIKNKPASDAVALLSLNWFILGTVTYPTLPKIVRLSTPMALSFVERIICWLGFSS